MAKSVGGLWIKGVRNDESVSIFWQVRTRYENGEVTFFDENGEVESRVEVSEVDWGELWRLGGTIGLTEEMIDIAGIDELEEFLFGLMRYAVGLIAKGYGETVSGVVEWFTDGFEDRAFIVEGNYLITEPWGFLEDLGGAMIEVLYGEDGERTSSVVVMGEHYDIDLEDKAVLCSFIKSVSPC